MRLSLQQCVEKVAKYLIVLQGDSYVTDHRAEKYLEDLKESEIKTLIQSIEVDIDRWATTIRYRNTVLASKKEVDEVIMLCERLIALAEKQCPALTNIKGGNLTPESLGF